MTPNWTEEQVADHQRRRAEEKMGIPLPARARAGLKSSHPDPSTPDHIADAGKMVRSPRPRMNKTEARYADRLRAVEIDFRFESVKLRLADRTWYTPDFWLPELREFREVKGGFIREDAWIKFKVAKEMYPEFSFQAWQWANNEWRRIG